MNKEQFLQWFQEGSRALSSQVTDKKPLVMGILNVTPDSFSDQGRFVAVKDAVARAFEMVSEGADIIDVGGESSRPGAIPLSLDEELTRVIPVIESIRAESDVCISIDTYKANVMQAAVIAGASLINDIKALSEENALTTAVQLKVPVCLMHMQGTPETMQKNPHYDLDIIDEINQFFRQRIQTCLEAGMRREYMILDPGFGFGKTVQHNLRMVHRFKEFDCHQLPLLLGLSRKSTIGTVLNKSVDQRLIGSLAATVYAAIQGAAIFRTHDVRETKQALQMVEAISKEAIFNEEL